MTTNSVDAETYRAMADKAMRESELQGYIINAARSLGWLVAHFRPALTAKGWRTAVEGDGVGFPDLCMVNPTQHRLIFAELKRANGTIENKQWLWHESLSTVALACDPVEVFIWRPVDWSSGRIEAVLRGGE